MIDLMPHKMADLVVPGDVINGYVVTESRAYLPNPDVMWLIFTTEPGLDGQLFLARDTWVTYTPRYLIQGPP